MNTLKKSFLIAFSFIAVQSFCQDSVKTEKIKTGWNFGAIPVISYNSDLGLQYGALTNIYNYGDGKAYPMYYHSFYAEVSRYTKGSGIYRIFYDSKFLIPNIRFTADFSYLPDQAFDFFGFNGAQAVFNKDWINDTSTYYKTRMFYKHKKNMLRIRADFQGKTGINHLNWSGGILLNNIEIATVDIDKLNKGKEGDDILKDTATLYDNYIEWGIIKENERSGGFFTTLKAGLVFDTRDNEPNPMKGVWSEAVLSQTLNSDFKFTKLSLTHRQYFTLIKNQLSFAYQLGYQGIIAGTAPYYYLTEMTYTYTPASVVEGLGGSKSVRGMVRNRVVGDGVVFGNMEFRWRFVKFNWINQNFYLALNPFVDFGQVIQEKEVDKSYLTAHPEIIASDYFNDGTDKLHVTFGCGFRIAMNQNFIIAVDRGWVTDEDDGDKSLYVGLNFLF